ncbi:uncharacterized protein [Phaseolus vulgaris]|uniref:uncharacterized protein n=1 Tax=Phaseolus vulgaris TaxID=3885 RepID=UPI0035C97085
MEYGSQEEDDWRIQNFEARHHHHQHQQPKKTMPFIKLPSFNGDNDPNIYLGWETKVEQMFNVYEVKEDQKIELASLEFEDYVMRWWHQLVMEIGLNKRLTMVSWNDFKLCMRAQFVPPHYRNELLLKLQRLHQGPRSMDEYFKDLEVTLIKINMHESEESKIVRFVSGLRREIQNVVELYEYTSLKKLVHLAVKVESQLLRKTSFKHTHNDGFYNSSWKDKNKFHNQDIPSNSSKESTPQTSKENSSPSRTKSPTKTSNKKCFKYLGFGHITTNCPNKRTMMVKGVIVVSDHSD